MNELVKVASVGDVPEGQMKLVGVGGQDVLLVHSGGKFYATGAWCTHDEGPLEEGELEGNCVRCPWHFSLFSLENGEVLESPAADPIPTHRVVVEGDDVLVALT
jgi:nitrite reductase/ring-hydroxylating ferredoxin subunit